MTIYASGSVNVDNALEPSKITIKQDDIRKALGVGDKGTPLSGARITRLFTLFSFNPSVTAFSYSFLHIDYFNPTSNVLAFQLRVKGRHCGRQCHGKESLRGQDAGYTAVVPSVTQGNLDQKLVPINAAKSVSPEQAEVHLHFFCFPLSLLVLSC